MGKRYAVELETNRPKAGCLTYGFRCPQCAYQFASHEDRVWMRIWIGRREVSVGEFCARCGEAMEAELREREAISP